MSQFERMEDVPEEWKEKGRKLWSKLMEISESWPLEPNDKELEELVNFSSYPQTLKDKFTEEKCKRCYMFHVLIGSGGTTKDDVDFFDFDGEDSIEEFVNNKYDEFVGSKKQAESPEDSNKKKE
jgi:hypothetical protein